MSKVGDYPTLSIYILCHKYLPLAGRAIRSVQQQKDPGFVWYINLMINTNDLAFLEEAKNTYGDQCQVLHSWSNGMPGAGKNACIQDWYDMDETEYMMIIDGDDWLYPYALWHLKRAWEMVDFDVLALQTHDMVAPFKVQDNQMQIRKDPPLYLQSWVDKQNNMTQLSPRTTWLRQLNKYATIDRVMLIKRDSDMDFPQYPEDMACYEDMVVDVKLLYMMLHDGLKYYHISPSGIYLYDSGAAGQVQNTLGTMDHQKPYEYHIRPLVEEYGEEKFDLVPHLEINQHESVNLVNKIDYINKTYDT